MAHKTGGGSTRKNKDSISKRLGIKMYGEQKALPGNILVRQKGNKFYPGVGVKQGNDYTLYSMTSGKVNFKTRSGKTIVDII
jgi:large subunit ribosomal protein L27